MFNQTMMRAAYVQDAALGVDPERLDMTAALPGLPRPPALLRDDRGDTAMLGMAVIAVLVILVGIAGLTPLGNKVKDQFLEICKQINSGTAC